MNHKGLGGYTLIWFLTFASCDKSTSPAKWQRVNGDWLTQAEIYTPLNCSGDSYCKGFALQSTNRDALKKD